VLLYIIFFSGRFTQSASICSWLYLMERSDDEGDDDDDDDDDHHNNNTTTIHRSTYIYTQLG